ncbi:hypothetical protein BDV35DRAFT_374840, partial [Aspergillus flavus]
MSSLAARLKSLLQQLLHRVKASPSRLTVLHSPSDASTDVVFAFGCTANRDWSWTTSSLDKAWRKTPFSAESRTARIFTFECNASVEGRSNASLEEFIDENARDLLESLSSYRKSGAMYKRPIEFVCFGLGEYVCMKALLISNAREDQYLHQIHLSTVTLRTCRLL